MSFSSSQVTMKNLLQRRNTSNVDDHQDDTPTELPLVQDSTNLPTTYHYHKRKQSDALVLSELDISQADVKATYSSLSPIEQGTAADVEEDGTYFDGNSQRWKSPLSSFFSSCQLMALFVILASLTTLHSVRSRRSKTNTPEVEDPGQRFDDDGIVEIGEPVEASYDEEWIEFYSSPDRMPVMKSAGPWPVDPKVGGLHMFESVCVTNNVDAPKPPQLDTSSRGLLYFSDKVKNPKRCVPCSTSQMNSSGGEGRWGVPVDSDSELGHHCGMNGLHAMVAKSVGDYSE